MHLSEYYPDTSLCSFMSPTSSDDRMTPQERPEQGKFSKDERAFLSTHLPAYQALCHQLAGKATGPKGKGSIKGAKKDWILKNVFPTFVKEFSSDQIGGPQLQSLQAVSCLLRYILVADEGC